MPITDIVNEAIQEAFAGLISWNEEDVKEAGIKTSLTDDLINNMIGTNVGRIFADVKISETHRFSTNITDQTLEDGSSIHEHAIPQQPQVTLQIEETNGSLLGGSIYGSYSGPQQLFEKLVSLWEHAVPLTVTTQHKQYKNMIIANMPFLHRAPYKNSLQISIDLKKLEFTKLETFSYKGKTEAITKAASSNVSGGLQKPIDMSSDFTAIDAKIASLGG